MNRADMIKTVERLLSGDGSVTDFDSLLGDLNRAAPYSGISDLIYYPDCDRTAEQIVEEALLRNRFLEAYNNQ